MQLALLVDSQLSFVLSSHQLISNYTTCRLVDSSKKYYLCAILSIVYEEIIYRDLRMPNEFC